MLNKRIIVLAIFIVSLMAISAVSAADNNSSELQGAADNCNVAATFNQSFTGTTEGNLNVAGSFSDLNDEIARSGGELNLTRNYAYFGNDSDYQEGIVIDKPITINGNGFTINGNNQARAFTVNADSVFLSNISFVNCSGYRGGAVYWSYSSNACLNDCSFVDCSAVFGGAVYFMSCDCFLSGCNFVSCSVGGNGGAIIFTESCDACLNGCGFVGCSGWDGGAICHRGGSINLSDVSFIDNGAYDGGAIYSFCDAFDLNNATFINNSALDVGGAIFCDFFGTFKDVIFIGNSAEKGGGAIDNNFGCIGLNNVSFINNNADDRGGAILNNYFMVCEDCEFINNVATEGDAIFSWHAVETTVDGCYFESKDSMFALIYGYYSDLSVYNSIFANTSSEYAPAIFVMNASLTVDSSQFINLKASGSAGAVAVKVFDSVTIGNCRFINTSSARNGGALFLDFSYDCNVGASEVYVSNTSFVNASGDFGGAYVQLGGKLNMSDSMFVNCTSKCDGGAVYLARVDVGKINNCTFDSNRVTSYDDYPTFGGALYVGNAILDIYGSKFISNSAFADSGAIGIYDSLYHIVNSTFDDGEAVHAIFKMEGSEVINCSGDYTISDKNVFYPQMIAGSAINPTLITNEIDVANPPIRFDLRDYNWTSPVKDQKIKGFCWAFGVGDSLESALFKSSGSSYDFSENNLNTMIVYSRYGANTYEGGTDFLYGGYLLSWLGPVPEEYDSYDAIGKISPVFLTSDKLHIQNLFAIGGNLGIGGVPSLKQAILKYGALSCNAVAASIEDGECPFYNPETCALYNPDYGSQDHEVCVVGWDDTFSRDNFQITPPGDGAWICKNSWGTDWGDEGYLYISYYDKTFSSGWVFLVENTVSYNKNYQYDFNGLDGFYLCDEGSERYGGPVTYANMFVAEDDDLIAAVGTYFNQSGINYTVKIEVNGKTVLTQAGISPYLGYHTIELDGYIPVRRGDEFRVYVTSNVLPVSYSPNLYYKANVSMTDYWGGWKDIFVEDGTVACIKAYTVDDDSKIINNNDISADYCGGSFFSVNVVAGDGHAVVAACVDFIINGKTTSALTDGNGVAKVKITDVPGTYTIKTVFNGKTYDNKVVVKHVLTASKVTVKKTAKKFTLKATLKINGKNVKGKRIIFKFKGKTYKATTNRNGMAKVTVKKNAIKKLKKGKTYTVKVTYLKDTIKTTVKVR